MAIGDSDIDGTKSSNQGKAQCQQNRQHRQRRWQR